jgi:hypothetical protein
VPRGEENLPPIWASRFFGALIRRKFARIHGAKSLVQALESIRDLPPYLVADEGRRIAGLPEDRIFSVAETAGEAK